MSKKFHPGTRSTKVAAVRFRFRCDLRCVLFSTKRTGNRNAPQTAPQRPWFNASQVGTLRRHELEIHANPSRLKCKYCPATYNRSEKLEKHLRDGNHHIEYYCRCCKQNLIFKSLKSKEQHLTRIHRKGKAYYLMACKNNPFRQRNSKYRKRDSNLFLNLRKSRISKRANN